MTTTIPHADRCTRAAALADALGPAISVEFHTYVVTARKVEVVFTLAPCWRYPGGEVVAYIRPDGTLDVDWLYGVLPYEAAMIAALANSVLDVLA